MKTYHIDEKDIDINYARKLLKEDKILDFSIAIEKYRKLLSNEQNDPCIHSYNVYVTYNDEFLYLIYIGRNTHKILYNFGLI